MSVYIKRKIRFPDEITHKRNTDRLGLGLSPICKAKPAVGEKLRMVTASKAVTCRACIEITEQKRAAARARMERATHSARADLARPDPLPPAGND